MYSNPNYNFSDRPETNGTSGSEHGGKHSTAGNEPYWALTEGNGELYILILVQ